jgi:hypothetical protein
MWPPVTEAHTGRRNLKRTMALRMNSCKEATAGEQQHEAQPMSKEVWTPTKPEEVLTPTRRRSAIHEEDN